MTRPAPAFSGQPLDRADHLRNDPDKLLELRRGARLLRLDGLIPQVEEDSLGFEPVGAGGGELVFLGLLAGEAVSLLLVATRRADWRTPVPFGPPLLAGAVLALLVEGPLG